MKCSIPDCRCCTFFPNDTIPLTEDEITSAIDIALERRGIHREHHVHNARIDPNDPYAEDIRGAIGELAFEIWNGQRALMDRSRRAGGDSGIDFRFGDLTVDVKTSQYRRCRLLVRQDKISADVYVLAWYDADRHAVVFLKATNSTMVDLAELKPVRNSNLRGFNHEMEQDDMGDLDWLRKTLLDAL